MGNQEFKNFGIIKFTELRFLFVKLQTIQQIFFQVLPANLYSHFIADVAIHDLKFVFI